VVTDGTEITAVWTECRSDMTTCGFSDRALFAQRFDDALAPIGLPLTVAAGRDWVIVGAVKPLPDGEIGIIGIVQPWNDTLGHVNDIYGWFARVGPERVEHASRVFLWDQPDEQGAIQTIAEWDSTLAHFAVGDDAILACWSHVGLGAGSEVRCAWLSRAGEPIGAAWDDGLEGRSTGWALEASGSCFTSLRVGYGGAHTLRVYRAGSRAVRTGEGDPAFLGNGYTLVPLGPFRWAMAGYPSSPAETWFSSIGTSTCDCTGL
jgi:hypothetical protein